MPIRKIGANVAEPEAPLLENRLIQEWQKPQEDADEPVIVEQSREGHSYPTHLYVIWNDWDGIEPFERSVIIMRAYEKTHGPEPVLYVTAAEGLTFEEAKRLRIPYE